MRDVFFGPETMKLHGVLMSSETGGAPGVVLCHPHPQFGGSMNNNVVIGIESILSEAGMTTLKFNFRGVGRSMGAFDGGRGEQEDVVHAINFLAADSSVGDICVCGYSFGALAGLSASVDDERVKMLAGVMPPTVMDTFDFLRGCPKPALLVAGSQDEFCDIKLVKGIARDAGATLEIIPGADHFLLNYEQRAGAFVRDFFS